MKRRKYWSRSFGPWGCTVRLYERGATNLLWLEIRVKGEPPAYKGLGHRDRALGIEQAKAEQAKLVLGIAPRGKAPTLGALLDAHAARLGERDDLRPSAAKDTARAVTYWKAMLGADLDASKITLDDIERACEKRRAGIVNAKGEPVAADKRQPVRTRAVGADLEALRAAYRWAVLKRKLLDRNPLDGMEIPEEANPRRPVANTDRYEATRAVAGKVTMELRGDGKRVQVASYLPELLDLAFATGRRLSAILALRYEDLRLDVPPFGALKWAAESDKMGREWTGEINATARAALDRVAVDREVGTRAKWPASPWLFPSPRNPSRPVSKDLASDWLERAEALAELPKLDGSLWHAYRRGWATSRKHHPQADVARAGGWKDMQTLARIYQQADPETTRRVVLEPRELRDS